MKKILLIGGTGNLGSTIIKGNLFKNIYYPNKKKLNLLKRIQIENYLKKNFDTIINCSGYPRIKSCEKNILKSFNLNYLTVKNLVDEIKIYNLKNNKNIRLIHISSDSVYESLKGNYSENDNYDPKTVYSVCKVLAEISVKNLENFCIIRTRFFNKKKFPYPDAAVDIFSSMIEVEELSKAIYDLSLKRFNGVINVGRKKRSDYEIYQKYFKKLKRTTRKKIQRNLGYFITKDSSLKLDKFYKFKKKIA